jgi:hypothetical protein
VPAQLTPAFAPVVADFDGDGKEDLFLSQNSFAMDRENGRCDAGMGLLLLGNGSGGFTAASAHESGIQIHGEQRGAAVGDMDADGRPDLVVAQHAAALKLFRNRGARPGIRVKLEGRSGNVRGIGAQARLKFGASYGPAREIHAGSGYWSQNSGVLVLAGPHETTALWVRWPGGTVTESPLPTGSFEVSVNHRGELRRLR